LIEAIADWDNKEANEEYKRSLKRQINHNFKGNLAKARVWATRELNKCEHEFDEACIEEWQIESYDYK
jgi:hypothetical protein